MAASGGALDRRRRSSRARRASRSGSARSAIEYLGPWARYWTPGLGASTTADWDVRGEHMAERCGLFVIICLGETLLISGATFAGAEWTREGIVAFLVNFLGTVAMWWLYFHIGQQRAAHVIEHSDDPGRVARIAFTYAHIPIIAGIVVSAVAAELVIAHPSGTRAGGEAASILGGPALFLAGNDWFKGLTARWAPLSHLVGLGLFASRRSFAVPWLSPLGLGTLALAILVVVAAWECVVARRRAARGGLRAPGVETEVRPAVAGEEAAVRALMRGERVNPLGIDWRNFVVAVRDGAVVGCVQLRPAGPGAVEVGSLVVRADLRGGGLGGRLLEAALARVGGRRAFIVVAAAPGGRGYERWGFRPVGLAAAPWTVRRNWLLGQAGSVVALAHGMRPRRLAILERQR